MLDQVELKYAQIKVQIERLLCNGPGELSRITMQAKLSVHQIDAAIARMDLEILQREADLRIFDDIPWWK